MSDGVLTSFAFLAALAGMAAFALANPDHWRQLFGAKPQGQSVRAACRLGGAALLGISFLFCALADPVLMAILVWPMLIGLAGAGVAAFLTLHARGRAGPGGRTNAGR